MGRPGARLHNPVYASPSRFLNLSDKVFAVQQPGSLAEFPGAHSGWSRWLLAPLSRGRDWLTPGGAWELAWSLGKVSWNYPGYRIMRAMNSSHRVQVILRCVASPTAATSLALLLLLAAAPAPAATVYKTVDAKGVVTYSDTPPAGEIEVETLVIDVQSAPPSEGVQEQLEAMRETTDRMVADRQQRERHRADMRKLQSESRPQVIDNTAPAGYDGTYTGYYPYNYPYPVYRPRPGHRPGYRPDGGHWPRPPLRPLPPVHIPAEDIISPGYDYPASLIRRSYSPGARAAFE